MNRSITGLYIGVFLIFGIQVFQLLQGQAFFEQQNSSRTQNTMDHIRTSTIRDKADNTTLTKPTFLSQAQKEQWEIWVKRTIAAELARQLEMQTEALTKVVGVTVKAQLKANRHANEKTPVTLSKEELIIQEESFATANELLENSIALGQIDEQDAREITGYFERLSVQQQHELLARYADAINNGEIEPSTQSLIGFF